VDGFARQSKQRDISLQGWGGVMTMGRRQHLYKKNVVGLSGGPSFVAMVQAADLRHSYDSPHFHRLDRSRLGRVLA
jgi:hypothetical protein